MPQINYDRKFLLLCQAKDKLIKLKQIERAKTANIGSVKVWCELEDDFLRVKGEFISELKEIMIGL